MGSSKGFIEVDRKSAQYRNVKKRVNDYDEVEVNLSLEEITEQAKRCMDCGIPFCHGAGCTLENNIPEWNDMVYKGRWKAACTNLHTTNNFPEFTGRICPALCEEACTLKVSHEPVCIRHIECQIVEKGFAEGWIVPIMPREKTRKRVAVVGSGPAGLACSQQLARFGHDVVLFEKDEKIGGLLRYGIPDFKLDKGIIDRRMEQMEVEGVLFRPGVEVGKDISGNYLNKVFDATCITTGAGEPRDLTVPGRNLPGVHFAMEFLSMQNKRVSNEPITGDEINAKGKNVVVIGGGDTGSDCVGTSVRQGAKSILQIEIMPKPPENKDPQNPWPNYTRVLRTSSSHQEGGERRWNIITKEFVKGNQYSVNKLKCAEVVWIQKDGNWSFKEVKDSEFEIDADLVLLATGFVHTVHDGIINELDLELDSRGNLVVNNNHQTSQENVFAAGDTVMGPSLVLKAINQGRKAAKAIDAFLK